MTEPREALAALLHQRCKDDWERRFANGALALTMHGVESHHDLAEYLIAAGVHLGDEGGLPPDFRFMGLTLDELRRAVATADVHDPHWRFPWRDKATEGDSR